MDGNGRWAKKRFMPRFFGHKQGVDALVRCVQACSDRGIEYLTVFAFSSENWKRPTKRCRACWAWCWWRCRSTCASWPRRACASASSAIAAPVNDKVRAAWDEAERTHRAQHAHHAVGGVQLRRPLGRDAGVPPRDRRRAWPAEQLDEATLSSLMALAHAPDPDLFIRTGGEVRISNFLLWQVAYAELYFTDCLWPDFDEAELDAALAAYAGRERRFGDVRAAQTARLTGG